MVALCTPSAPYSLDRDAIGPHALVSAARRCATGSIKSLLKALSGLWWPGDSTGNKVLTRTGLSSSQAGTLRNLSCLPRLKERRRLRQMCSWWGILMADRVRVTYVRAEKAARLRTEYSRWPVLRRHGMVHGSDKVVGGIVCAGYIKLEEYVTFAWRDLRHSSDPGLAAVLESARSPYANDLHGSNLAGMPVLIKYCADDNSVPPWHSRAMVTLLKHWNAAGSADDEDWPRLVEVPARGHWWDEILQEDDVQEHVAAVLARPRYGPLHKFTLTSVIPHITQGRFGWHIAETEISGRLARLEVEYMTASFDSLRLNVLTRNVRQISLSHWALRVAAKLRFSSPINCLHCEVIIIRSLYHLRTTWTIPSS